MSKICQTKNLTNDNLQTISDKCSAYCSPTDWNPQKQSPGQVLDKFGAWGFFEGCTKVGACLNAVRGRGVATFVDSFVLAFQTFWTPEARNPRRVFFDFLAVRIQAVRPC